MKNIVFLAITVLATSLIQGMDRYRKQSYGAIQITPICVFVKPGQSTGYVSYQVTQLTPADQKSAENVTSELTTDSRYFLTDPADALELRKINQKIIKKKQSAIGNSFINSKSLVALKPLTPAHYQHTLRYIQGLKRELGIEQTVHEQLIPRAPVLKGPQNTPLLTSPKSAFKPFTQPPSVQS